MIIGAVLFLLLFVYMWFIEPRWLAVTTHQVAVNPARMQKKVRILLLSDLHLGRFTSAQKILDQLEYISTLHETDPFAVICLGGDYLDYDPRYLSDFEQVIKRLVSFKVPIVAVLGNHDYYTYKGKFEPLQEMFSRHGVKFLRNEALLIEQAKQKIVFVGLEELQSTDAYCGLDQHLPFADYPKRAAYLNWYKQFDEFHPELLRVVLVHNPDGVYLQGRRRPELLLAGHTHGGQVNFVDWIGPFFPPIVPPGSFITWAGRRIINHTTVLVSRGLGGSSLPIRLLRRPEAIIAELVPAHVPLKLIIGLAGKPRVGKDTVAALLEDRFPGITRTAFGHAIKEEYDSIHGTNTRHSEEEKVQYRSGIQDLGTNRREKDVDYWIKKTLIHEPPLLITDVRLEREIEIIRSMGGVLVRVEAAGSTLQERMGEYYHHHHMNHVLETGLDAYGDWDYVIHNNGSMEELGKQVDQLCRALEKRYSESTVS